MARAKKATHEEPMEQVLWTAANKLRKNMDAAEYKHVVLGLIFLKYISDEEFNNVKDHPLIKEISYNRTLCDGVENEVFLKRRTEFWYYDDLGLKLGFSQPTSGHKPVDVDEVIADTKTLQLLGVPLEIGAPISLILDIRVEKVQRDFVLAGWWESDPVFNVGRIFASRAYVDAHIEELKSTYKDNNYIDLAQ